MFNKKYVGKDLIVSFEMFKVGDIVIVDFIRCDVL